MKTINLSSPFNATSLGQTSYNIFKGIIRGGASVKLFPKQGQIDLSCFKISEEDNAEVQKALDTPYDRENGGLQIWHIRDSEPSVSRSSALLTFHETSKLTQQEVDILSQHDQIFLTSTYTQEVFAAHNINHTIYLPLGFDSDSFSPLPKEESDVITFGLRGKLESRKNTLRIMALWAKTFGGNPRYRLDCSVHNFFLKPEELNQMILSAMPDKCLPWNINLLPFCQQNETYNQALNNADIDLTGMSSCEGFNLPLFQSLGLGKHAVVLNAHVHKDYCNSENSVLVEPSGMRPAEDGVFFLKDGAFNQGEWFDFNDDDFVEAMGLAITRFKKSRINESGLKLSEWSWENTGKTIVGHV